VRSSWPSFSAGTHPRLFRSRGLRALNTEFSNKLAILAGDFLLARASVTLASLRDVDVVMLLSTVIEDLVTGEVMQSSAKPDELLSFDHYLEKTHFKTASLIANSCRAVAMLGGPDGGAPAADAACAYGRNLGLAFQIIDDCLDFTGSALSLGKPALSDLQSGIATAPVLFAAQAFPALAPLVRRRFRQPGDVEQARQWVAESTGVQQARELAERHCRLAAEAVLQFPPPRSAHAEQSRQALLDLTQRVLHRTK
jgi:geranyl diphosphate synthase